MTSKELIVEIVLPGADSVRLVRNLDSFKTLTMALAAYLVRCGYDATVNRLDDFTESIKADIKDDIAGTFTTDETDPKTDPDYFEEV